MKRKLVLIALIALAITLISMACGPDRGGDIEANNNIAPENAVIGVLDIPLVIPSGGSYDEPVINLMGACPTFGNFVIHVLYSPTDITITQVHNIATARLLACTRVQAGDVSCASTGNPSRPNFTLDVCYRGGGSVEESCREVSMVTPGCPAYAFNPQLLSVECLPGSKVRFTVETGTDQIFHVGSCMGSNFCTDESHRLYECHYSTTAPTQEICIGDAPTQDLPLMFGFLVSGMSVDEGDALRYYFADFFHLANRCIWRPTETSSVSAPPAQTCADQKTQDDCKMFGGCYWWSGGGCHSDPEPQQPPPPPGCDTYGDEKACTTNGCKWDPYAKPPCY
jgi:hypothetical protein